MRPPRAALVLLAGGAAMAASLATSHWLRANPPRGPALWRRTNYRGSSVSLLGGPIGSAGAMVGAVAAAPSLPSGTAARAGSTIVAALAATSAAGLYDDLAGDTSAKGFGGHLRALRKGRVTSGMVKVAVISVSAGAVGTATGECAGDMLLSGALVASTANLVNLLDLRPGRAAKSVALLGAPLLLTPGGAFAAAAVGTVAATIGDDLGEQTMLGDCGANTVGALLGTAAVAGLPISGRAAWLTVALALTAVSERVSFSRVIESTPGLRELDRLGRAG